MSVSSTSNDPVAAVIDILQGYTTWTNTAPEVFRQPEVPQKERENATNPRIYVWSPTDASIDKFDAKGSFYDELNTIEANIWVLTDTDGSAFSECEQYQDDVVDIFGDYATDNYSNLQFHNLNPSSKSDSRQERIARQTDHYVMSVQCEIRDLRSGGT